MWLWEAICSASRRIYPLWTENIHFAWPLAANHQLLIEPVYQRCSSKWCCPSVLSHCLSLCTVNMVGDSWLHLKLWGHYILTCSLFTLRLPPISNTPACYLSPSHYVHHPLSGYIILCMHAQRDSVKNTQPQGSVWFTEYAGWICLEKDKKKVHNFSLEYNIIHPMSVEIVPQRLNSRSLHWPASSTLLWCLFGTVFELDVPQRHHCILLEMTGTQARPMLT